MGYSPRVLVIDDEPVVVKSCDRILRREGIEVEGFSDGRSGLDFAEKSSFDAVLLDLKMPDMSGIDVLRRLKKAKPTSMVIIITGYPAVETAVEAMKLGAFDYLVKPFTPGELTGTVRKALEQPGRKDDRKTAEEREPKPTGFPGQMRSIRTVTSDGKRVAVIGLTGTFGPDSELSAGLVESLKRMNAPITSEYGEHEVSGKEIIRYLEENDKVVVVTRARMGIGAGKVLKFKAGEMACSGLNSEFAVIQAGLPQVSAWARAVGIDSEVVVIAVESPRLGEESPVKGAIKDNILGKILYEFGSYEPRAVVAAM